MQTVHKAIDHHLQKPQFANELYKYAIEKCKEQIKNVETGVFGADMQVSLINDGPVTIMLQKGMDF